MPTFTHGKDALVLMDGRDMSEFFSTATTTGSADTAEVTTFGASSKAYIPGSTDATVSVEGYYAGGVGEVDEVLAAMTGGAGVWTVVFADSLAARGSASAVIGTSYEVGAEVGGAISVSAEGQSTTGTDGVTVLYPLGAVTASGTGTQVDGTVATTNGSACYLHVTDLDGVLAVKVQHSADGSVWVDLASFSPSGISGERVVTTGTVNRYLRASWTLSGTSPTASFHLSAARL